MRPSEEPQERVVSPSPTPRVSSPPSHGATPLQQVHHHLRTPSEGRGRRLHAACLTRRTIGLSKVRIPGCRTSLLPPLRRARMAKSRPSPERDLVKICASQPHFTICTPSHSRAPLRCRLSTFQWLLLFVLWPAFHITKPTYHFATTSPAPTSIISNTLDSQVQRSHV